MIMQKKSERRRKRQEMRSAQHIAQQAREATPPDDEDMVRHAETPPGEPHQHGYARYAKQEVDTPPRPQHQSSFAANHGNTCVYNTDCILLNILNIFGKTKKMTCVTSQYSRSAWANALSEQSPCCLPEEDLDP